MTGPTNNNNTAQNIVHNTGNSTSPGNCTKYFYHQKPTTEDQRCTTNAAEAQSFEEGRIFRLSSVTYFIRNNSASPAEPALYRQRLTQNNGNAATIAEELLQGVQDMQIVYGVDTTATPDGAVDSYIAANAVTDWSRVLGVRVTLLLVSQQGQNITTKPQTYSVDKNGDGDVDDSGETVTPNDRLLRKTVSATFAVRNRL